MLMMMIVKPDREKYVQRSSLVSKFLLTLVIVLLTLVMLMLSLLRPMDAANAVENIAR